MDIGSHNEKMASLLIEHLIAGGVERFCLSPGSRSTAFALAIARYPLAQFNTHYDERGLSFYALGRSKGSRKPVAIFVTSGTAVANMLPAVMEASNDHVPLILITADRPQELRDCSANQTVDQVKIFANFIRWQADLPFSDKDLPSAYLAATIAQAIYFSQSPLPGPVHLNCMIREPFFSLAPIEKTHTPMRFCEKSEWIPSEKTIQNWSSLLSSKKRGLIIIGALPHDTNPMAIFTLAEKLGWPIYADILSQLRSHNHTHLISHFDILVQAQYHEPVEAIVHFGGRTVSKSISEWLKNQNPTFYLHVSDYPTRMDPHCIITHRLHAPCILCAHLLSKEISSEPDPYWLTFWKQGDEKIQTELTCFFSSYPTISEPGIIYQIGKSITADIGLFLANSMPIRDADKFFPAQIKKSISISMFGNRGVSGIDGNIATAIGIAEGIQKPLIAILGDLAFLHDLNSLALLDQARYPICLIIINNAGGGIFSFMPVYTHHKGAFFERLFAASHTYSFASAAALFNLSYAKPQTLGDFDALLFDFAHNKRSILIEVETNREENLYLHQKIANQMQTALYQLSEITLHLSGVKVEMQSYF